MLFMFLLIILFCHASSSCILFNSWSYYTIFNSITKLKTSRGIRTKEARAENETHPLTTEAKKSKCSI